MARTRPLLLVLLMLAFAQGCLSGCWQSQVLAQTPLGRFALFRRIESRPDADFRLTPENGPWMIMAATFSGEGARDQARDLVMELRREHKLMAYVYEHEFDFREEKLTGRGMDRHGEPLRMRYRKNALEEIAVMVGDYKSLDDPRAQKELFKIKDIEPTSLDITALAKSGRKQTFQQLVGWRLAQKVQDDKKIQREFSRQNGATAAMVTNHTRRLGPMGSAFLTRNPIRREEDQAQAATIGKFVYEMNKNVKYSLLDCPQKYTIRVATFTGNVIVNQGDVRDIQRGQKELKSRLAEAALRAHEMTVALRELGYQAYEFHDRQTSIVTIGGFDFVGTPQEGGQVELNPKIFKVIEKFKAKQDSYGNLKVETLMGIPLDVQPMVVAIPRRSISADYIGGLFGTRR